MPVRPASVLLCAFALSFASGCKASPTAAAPAASPARAASASLPTTTQTVVLNDPSLGNIPAVNLTIPSGWKADGIMTNDPCGQLPSPVYRVYSPDGLTEMRFLPTFGWNWYSNGKSYGANSGCLPLPGPMSAAQFAQYYVGTITGGVHIVGPMPVSPEFQQGAQKYADLMNANNARLIPQMQADNTGDTAALHIETVNGSFVIDQRIRVRLQCAKRSSGFLAGGTCLAYVDVLRAPKGKLEQLAAFADSHHVPRVTPTQQWSMAYSQRQQRQSARELAIIREQGERNSAMLHQQFEQSMQMLRSNHEQFMQQQESSFRSSMNNANNAMNARSTASSDWVDYALDQQTVTGPGGTVKVSSAYGTTWSNGQGQWYQTNDSNSDPNGVLYGNWTRDTKVHGNGQPY